MYLRMSNLTGLSVRKGAIRRIHPLLEINKNVIVSAFYGRCFQPPLSLQTSISINNELMVRTIKASH